MNHRTRAFTLIELLVVIAIIAILAAILFPVFAQAKEAAKKTADLSNSKQVNLSVQQYMADNDDYMPPVNGCDWGSAVYGTTACPTWPEITYPYTKNWMIHRNIMEGDDAAYTADPSAADNSPQCSSPNLADCEGWRSNWGYNFLYLSLPVYDPGSGANGKPNPMSSSQINKPAGTVLAANSIWNRGSSGAPMGGGNWAANAPCIYTPDGSAFDVPTSYSFYYLATATGAMWDYESPTSATQFGYYYPFYNAQTMLNVTFTDGHSKAQHIGDMVAGCDPDSMLITDYSKYEFTIH